MIVKKEQIITVVKGLTRQVNIKQEHLEIIDRALKYNNYSQEEWEEILNRNNIDLALNNKIYTMEIVRFLTLRAIILPDTVIEYFTWLNEGKNNQSLNYSLDFKAQIDSFFKGDKVLHLMKINLTKVFEENKLLNLTLKQNSY